MLSLTIVKSGWLRRVQRRRVFRFRSAETGKFVPPKVAEQTPRTTVRERIRRERDS